MPADMILLRYVPAFSPSLCLMEVNSVLLRYMGFLTNIVESIFHQFSSTDAKIETLKGFASSDSLVGLKWS